MGGFQSYEKPGVGGRPPGKINASLNEKLSSVKWGEFQIGEYFTKLELKYKKSYFDKELDISKDKTKEYDLPVVNAKDGNNGIMYYGRSSDFESAEMTIDIVNDGAVSTGNVYPQPQKTGVLYNAYLISPRFHSTRNTLIFVSCAIQKSIKSKYGYEYKASWNRVKKDFVKLPVKADDTIDFDFIESFIAELEAERVAELEAERVAELSAYLTVSGLDNYELSEQELKALADLKNVTWGKYKMGDLFEKVKTKKLPYKAKELPTEATGSYTLPCLTSSFKNQGLNYFAPKQGATVLKSVITIPQNSDVYRAYYQSSDFTVLSDR